jgi:hypothetical protein
MRIQSLRRCPFELARPECRASYRPGHPRWPAAMSGNNWTVRNTSAAHRACFCFATSSMIPRPISLAQSFVTTLDMDFCLCLPLALLWKCCSKKRDGINREFVRGYHGEIMSFLTETRVCVIAFRLDTMQIIGFIDLTLLRILKRGARCNSPSNVASFGSWSSAHSLESHWISNAPAIDISPVFRLSFVGLISLCCSKA